MKIKEFLSITNAVAVMVVTSPKYTIAISVFVPKLEAQRDTN